MQRPAILLLALTAAAPLPPAPSHATFGRWIAVCDNTRQCEARGFPDVPGSADLRVLRHAGNAPATVILTIADPHDPGPLRADATPLPPLGWKTSHADGGTTLTLDRPEDVATLVAQLRNTHTLAWEGAEYPIPLDGMTAALLNIDAIQGRPGTPTPLIAPPGTAPVPPAPAPPPAPTWSPTSALNAAEAKRLIAATRAAANPALKAGDCNPAYTEDDDANALDPRHALVIVSCMMHAYQASSMAYIVSRQGPLSPTRATLPVPSMKPEDWLTSGGFDPKTGTITSFAKGRGLADCGFSATWVWSAGAFHPTAVAYQELCGGAAAGDWPPLLRTAPAHR